VFEPLERCFDFGFARACFCCVVLRLPLLLVLLFDAVAMSSLPGYLVCFSINLQSIDRRV